MTAMTRDSVIYWAKMLWDIDLIISSVVTDASMMLHGGFTKALSIVPEGGNAAARGGNAFALWAVICDSTECISQCSGHRECICQCGRDPHRCEARLPCCEGVVSVEFATDFAHNWRQNGKELTRHWEASKRLIVQQYIQKLHRCRCVHKRVSL